MRFKIATLNVKNNPLMSQSKVRHDVKRASTLAGIIGWNEIEPARYRAAIRNQLGRTWSHYFPMDGHVVIPNPISWRNTRWTLHHSGWVKTHNGRKRVSPNRYITYVVLVNNATGKQVVKINTHTVSAGWSGYKATRAWRRKMWYVHQAAMEKLIVTLTLKYPEAFIQFSGDFNRDRSRVVGTNIAEKLPNGRSVSVPVDYDNDWKKNTHGRRIYDIVGHIDHSGVRVLRRRVDPHFYSDHNSVITTYEWN